MARKTLKMGSLISKHIRVLICLLLAMATFVVYFQVRNHKFINFDDNVYVTENTHVRAGLSKEAVRWSFSIKAQNKQYWHPLTWLSHMLDCQLYGLNAGMHHIMNVLFHILNVLLLFIVFRRLTGSLWHSAFIAAIFAIHPINVDTVAWISERKNIISTSFWMLTMLAYSYYVKRPCIYRYLLVLLSFSLGLLSKPTLATIPFVFLLLDYWPLRRVGPKTPVVKSKARTAKSTIPLYHRFPFSRLLLEKVPLLLLSGLSVFLSSLPLQYTEKVITADLVPIDLRIANALVSPIIYIGKILWPHNLAVYYPFPTEIPVWQAAGAALILIAIFTLVILQLRLRPYLAIGWFWYIVTLMPTIGLFQAGLWPAMADRWAYIPLIGIFIMFAWGVPDILSKWRRRQLAQAISSVLLVLAFMIYSWIQVGHWKNSVTLFNHTVHVTKNNHVAYTNLGHALMQRGSIEEAIRHFYTAVSIKPDYSRAHYDLGVALFEQGRFNEAIRHYQEAIRINPNWAEAHNNLGNALMKQGNLDTAAAHFYEVLRIQPMNAKAHNNLGCVFELQGDLDNAIAHFNKALYINPNYAKAHYNLGIALLKRERIREAIGHFNEALRIDPNDKKTRYILQRIWHSVGQH